MYACYPLPLNGASTVELDVDLMCLISSIQMLLFKMFVLKINVFFFGAVDLGN